jgi:hypothetical protein
LKKTVELTCQTLDQGYGLEQQALTARSPDSWWMAFKSLLCPPSPMCRFSQVVRASHLTGVVPRKCRLATATRRKDYAGGSHIQCTSMLISHKRRRRGERTEWTHGIVDMLSSASLVSALSE